MRKVSLYKDFINEKLGLSEIKKIIKTKEYKEVSQAINNAEEASDIWNMLDPKMFKFTESEFEDIFNDWWNDQSYDSLGEFSTGGSTEDAISLYKHLLPYVNESVITEEDGRDTLAELNDMTLGQLERIEDYAEMISDRMEAGQQLESWMFSQITGAVDNLNAVHDAMDGTDGIEEASAIEEDENPCWDGYKVGDPKTKVSTRTGKRVNNCVPKNESTLIAEAIDPRSFTIFQIATPAPRAMLVAELRDLFNEKTINIQFNDNEGYESVIMFNLSKSDIKKIEANIGDVLVWEYSIGKGKSII